MTVFAYIDGVEVTDRMRLENGIVSASTAADGTPATAGLRIDDKFGTETYLPLQEFHIIETDCVNQRVFTGYTLNASIDRGVFRVAAGRVWEFDVPDLNFLLHRLVFTAASANRPRESVAARLAWLLASPQMSGVVDNGLATGTPWMLDESDYRGQYPDQVLQSMCVSSVSDENAFIFFVYWDHAAGEAALFFDQPTAPVNDSTLRISNVLGDKDDSITFAPHIDGRLQSDGEGIYDGVYFTTRNGSIYRQRPATYTAFGLHRDGTFSTDRINLGTTAENHAQAWLLTHSGKSDTILCTVRLPSTHVNLIDAGMRVQVKFSHLPGYSAFTWTRVTRRSVVLSDGTNDYYELQLELSVKGINVAGSGGGTPGPGGFPNPPAGNPIVQQVSGRGQLTMPNAITAGNTLVYVAGTRAQNVFATGDGAYTNGPDGTTRQTGFFGDAGGGDGAGLVYKIATASEPTSNGGGLGGNWIGTWYELLGAWAPDATAHAGAIGTGVSPFVGSISAPAGIVFGVGALGEGGAFDGQAAPNWYTPGAGWTEDCDNHSDGGHPVVETAHMILTAPASVSFNPTGTSGYSEKWAAQVVAFTSTTFATSNPPTPGQWVGISPPESVTLTAGAGTTAFPFADGSLRVFYDIVEQTAAIVSYNGATGAFTMPSQPPLGTQVFVQYQGR